MKELAAIPELTGVHLDYAATPTPFCRRGYRKKHDIVQDRVYPQYDYGYTEYERNRFRREFGALPLTLEDPKLRREWFRFQLDMVTGLIITAGVFPGPSSVGHQTREGVAAGKNWSTAVSS